MSHKPLKRFLDAQQDNYIIALSEMKKGSKVSHWMWYVFPQMRGLGKSNCSKHYGIHNFEEATAYFNHAVLGKRLIEISRAVLEIENRSAREIFGSPDDKKLKSCMTLFAMVPHADPVFKAVLKKFFKGEYDLLTLNMLERTM